MNKFDEKLADLAPFAASETAFLRSLDSRVLKGA
jgi:hypothetical protein